MYSKSIGFTFILTLVLIANLARSSTVTLWFSGTINSRTDNSNLGYVPAAIQTGGSFTGTVSFNNAATASSTDATDAYYSGTDLDMTVSITIDGQYQYTLLTPSSSDEIDLEGTSFNLFKRGPTVYTSFSPDPPFSHLDFELQTDTDRLDLIGAHDLSLGTTPAAGVSDAQTAGAGYYYVGAGLTSVVPEPSTMTLMGVAVIALLAGHSRSIPRRLIRAKLQ